MSTSEEFLSAASAASGLKTIYDAYVAAGFTADQAMQILCTMLAGGSDAS